MVWRCEKRIQENAKGDENKIQPLTRQNRASRRDWLPMAEWCRPRKNIREALSRADIIQRGVWTLQCSCKVFR